MEPIVIGDSPFVNKSRSLDNDDVELVSITRTNQQPQTSGVSTQRDQTTNSIASINAPIIVEDVFIDSNSPNPRKRKGKGPSRSSGSESPEEVEIVQVISRNDQSSSGSSFNRYPRPNTTVPSDRSSEIQIEMVRQRQRSQTRTDNSMVEFLRSTDAISPMALSMARPDRYRMDARLAAQLQRCEYDRERSHDILRRTFNRSEQVLEMVRQ